MLIPNRTISDLIVNLGALGLGIASYYPVAVVLIAIVMIAVLGG